MEAMVDTLVEAMVEEDKEVSSIIEISDRGGGGFLSSSFVLYCSVGLGCTIVDLELLDCDMLLLSLDCGGSIGIREINVEGVRKTCPSGVRTAYVVSHVAGLNVEETIWTRFPFDRTISCGRNTCSEGVDDEMLVIL